ncbi:MAG: helix-turn-helix domain-containing protein [Pedobacter sp.]|uniref:winged helix-turn-helix transcriptional regulator n=1 Tax=Pedobacter sp. TaxID=1411316 RepID=UPI0033955D9E
MNLEDCSPGSLQENSCEVYLKSIADTFYAIGGKWKLRIIVAMSEGPIRFNVLQRKLGNISPRVLSNELKDLELTGLIQRNVMADATPVIAEYQLAAYSSSLKDLVQAMIRWGIDHREKLKNDHHKQNIKALEK